MLPALSFDLLPVLLEHKLLSSTSLLVVCPIHSQVEYKCGLKLRQQADVLSECTIASNGSIGRMRMHHLIMCREAKRAQQAQRAVTVRCSKAEEQASQAWQEADVLFDCVHSCPRLKHRQGTVI